MLVPLPIGLFVFALIADVVFRAGGAPVWNAIAFWSLVVGVLGALVAAVPGFIDFTGLPRSHARTLATTHMVLNLTIVVLQAVSVWLRTRTAPGAGSPFLLTIIGDALLLVSGWLGWEMVYRYGVGIDRGVSIRVEERRETGRGAA